MLADDLIASLPMNRLGWGHTQLIHDLRKAHRFELDSEFAEIADELGRSNPSSFVKCLPLCRLPYEFCWIETADYNRKSFQSENNSRTRPIKRVGVLLRQSPNSGVWIGNIGWSFQDGSVGFSPVALAFDPTASHAPFEGEKNEFLKQRVLPDEITKDDLKSIGFNPTDANVEASRVISGIIAVVPSIYHKVIFENKKKVEGPKAINDMVSSAVTDWQAEPNFWLAVIALINSKNAPEISLAAENERLNKARARRKQQPLLAFRICKISSRFSTGKGGRNGSAKSQGPVRSHFVRGHFKVRSSGIFWWSAFLRGDQRQGFADKDYRVTTPNGK